MANILETAKDLGQDIYTKSEVDTVIASSSMEASDILTAIKTVDGSGSGLDADTLDGVSWGNVNTNIVTSGDLTVNGGDIVLGGTGRIQGIDTVSASTDAASKGYVDSNSITLTTGSAPYYGCRAWVNFNGTGTVAIRASGNVSSITDNGVGIYTANLSTAMSDTNGCVTANGAVSTTNTTERETNAYMNSTSTIIIYVTAGSGSSVVSDATYVHASVFR
jgi:hypothetical protein